MAININIENTVAETAQSCSKDSTAMGDVFELYGKVATALALVLCACLASGFITILRAIRAVHADLVMTRKAGVHTQIPAISENSTEPASPTTEAAFTLEADAAAASNSSKEAEMLGAWWEVGNVTFAWLGRSVSATVTTVTGMIPGFTPNAEIEDELPSPVSMTR